MEQERLDALLAAYSDGSLTADGLDELHTRLRDDPAARRFAARWFDQERHLRRLHEPARLRLRARRWRWRLLAAAAGLLLGIGTLAWLAWPGPELGRCLDGALIAQRGGLTVRAGDTVQTTTAAGAILLPDGSRLALAPHSALAFPGDGPPLLRSGRVEATVHPQAPGHPFVLLTPQARIEVLGTRFALAVVDDGSQVQVLEGHVRFIERIAGWRRDLLAGNGCASGPTPPPLIPLTARWRIRDHDETPLPGWQQPDFDDADWRHGDGPFGFGRKVQPVATALDAGDGPGARHLTAYFRHAFAVEDPAGLTALVLRYRVDDGMVVYLNGHEVLRDHMPDGPVSGTTLAKAATEPLSWREQRIAAALRPGRNLLAIEVHQRSRSSSDLLLAVEASTSP